MRILKLECGIPGCKAKPMLRPNLNAHQLSIHKNGPIKGQNTLVMESQNVVVVLEIVLYL